MPPTQPKTHSYANAFYAHMADNAVDRVIDGKPFKVWEGSITKTCRELGIPAGTERRVIRPLEQMGAIQMLSRGVANYPTIIALIRPPTEELWADVSGLPLTGRLSYDRLVRKVEEIERQLGGVNLAEVLKDHNRRLTRLEGKGE